jgi:hypothetical protein
MAEEANISREESWYYAKLAQRCLDGLARNNIPGYYCPDIESACTKILELVPPDATVGFGDSVTLYQVGIIAELEGRQSNLLVHPFYHNGSVHYPESRRDVVKKGKEILNSDYYLTGANAITMHGKIVNTDGVGNRVAGLIFGPRRVLVVAGINKVVRDLEQALDRIKTIAAPLNTHRHNLKHGLPPTPCSSTGICSDCHLPSRICNYTVIVEYQPSPRIQVVLVGHNLGY